MDLRQLIDACGDSFCRLVKERDGWSATGMISRENDFEYTAQADTPEEAVSEIIIEIKREYPE